jgi:hypothetical protein
MTHSHGKTALALALAALVPGLGHIVLGRVRRGFTYLLIVLTTFLVGIRLDGRLHAIDWDHPLTVLAAVTSYATGLLNLVARARGYGAGDIRSVTFEYGTAFLTTAALMNLLLFPDVFEIARGRKA